MKWTLKDINNYNSKRGKPHVKKQNKSVKMPKGASKISIEIQTIKKMLWVLKNESVIPEYFEELKFHPTRKWRFDFAIPELMLAIEYEGLMSEKSGHTTVQGYTNDCEKYNQATILGWNILRYTALNYGNLYSDVILFAKSNT